MPELPEVETIVRELKPKLIGKKFWSVEGKLQHIFLPSFEEVAQKLPGLTILDITRQGKYIIFILERNMRLVIHLRMSGRLLWKKSKNKEKFIRAIFHFTNATSLIFSDMRKFGRIWLYPQKEFAKATGIYKLGLEPFTPEFTFKNFEAIFTKRRGILKNTLLRQDVLSGIGNIYADEICFRIGLHPSSQLANLTKKDLEKMFEATIHCLQEGINHCGASVSDFVGTRGTLGKHQKYLQIYGRKGDQCYRCSSIIQKTRVAGRGTFFCLRCQPQV